MAEAKSQELQMIYLDRNYPPAEIQKTLQAINAQAAKLNVTVRRVALVPHIAKGNYCK